MQKYKNVKKMQKCKKCVNSKYNLIQRRKTQKQNTVHTIAKYKEKEGKLTKASF